MRISLNLIILALFDLNFNKMNTQELSMKDDQFLRFIASKCQNLKKDHCTNVKEQIFINRGKEDLDLGFKDD